MKPYVFAGGTAVVTGGGSGIGEALAYGLAARGSHLVLVDQYADRLDRVAAAVRAAHPRLSVLTVTADLSDHGGTIALGRQLAAEHPETTLLINNAGVAMAGDFEQLTLAEFEWLLQINFSAVVALTHGLLPVLLSHPGSAVVAVSSVFGLFAPPTQTAYVASKFAVRGFTESLRHELVGRVGVTVVHPGGVASRIATDARISAGADRAVVEAGRAQLGRILTIPPERAAAIILRAVEHRRPRVLIGWTARVPDLVVRLLPGSYGQLLGVFAGSRLDPRSAAGRELR